LSERIPIFGYLGDAGMPTNKEGCEKQIPDGEQALIFHKLFN
jgi:hypothetical protein